MPTIDPMVAVSKVVWVATVLNLFGGGDTSILFSLTFFGEGLTECNDDNCVRVCCHFEELEVEIQASSSP